MTNSGLDLDQQFELLKEVFYTLALSESLDVSLQMNSDRGGLLVQVSAQEFLGEAEELLDVVKNGLHPSSPYGYLEVESQLPYSFVITARKENPW